MRLLLDTHILLWWLRDDRKLTKETERYISSSENDVYVSAVSTWEVAIKKSIGRLSVNLNEFDQAIIESGLTILPITMPHTLAVASLPMHHSDPFDRLLIAQSIVEPMRIVTHDETVGLYGDHIIVV